MGFNCDQTPLAFLLIVQSTAFAEARLRPQEWASTIIGSGLENFYRLDKKVFRSEQPDRETFFQVEKFGMKEVLDLRQYHTDNGEAAHTQLVLHRVGMKAASVSYPQILQAPKTKKNAGGPILIHCWHLRSCEVT